MRARTKKEKGQLTMKSYTFMIVTDEGFMQFVELPAMSIEAAIDELEDRYPYIRAAELTQIA